eukprot:CAMPEP_0194252512 /NCGR_PEP_ID=MMETSP0158-20130606/27798_1 /TAXON_ID=33649 /ORGANISM="Thalassionema nitzschioides, Strain L26-B" /LENGTH=163 /DNA_ID=CAMNT_0038989945 /DNA_START=32 /DNA_END=520 /DNA_ORIENTATION=-
MSSQRAESTASAVRESLRNRSFSNGLTGNYGVSQSDASNASALMSGSEISNQVNLVVQGCIPSIVASDIPSTVKRLKPTPEAVMGMLTAIQSSASDAVMKSPAAAAADGRRGNQYQAVNSAHADKTIEKTEEVNTEQNRVIDTNSMMTAFEDYVKKCREGKCG